MEFGLPRHRFALNHMAAPGLDIGSFFALACQLGIRDVEIRNDLDGTAILDGTPAELVRAKAGDAGIAIVTINALQRFNDWTSDRAAEATALADYAAACGARALVLVPTNDGSGRGNGERQGKLRVALKALAPILSKRDLLGLVEPLGFATCSLRSKNEAAEAIEALGLGGVFGIVHDTFHHHLAGESDMLPAFTRLVHISGVADHNIDVSRMRDEHRELVGAGDRLGNIGQIQTLLAGGYAGPFSFEPFAPEVQTLAEPGAALRRSMDFIMSNVIQSAA